MFWSPLFIKMLIVQILKSRDFPPLPFVLWVWGNCTKCPVSLQNSTWTGGRAGPALKCVRRELGWGVRPALPAANLIFDCISKRVLRYFPSYVTSFNINPGVASPHLVSVLKMGMTVKVFKRSSNIFKEQLHPPPHLTHPTDTPLSPPPPNNSNKTKKPTKQQTDGFRAEFKNWKQENLKLNCLPKKSNCNSWKRFWNLSEWFYLSLVVEKEEIQCA